MLLSIIASVIAFISTNIDDLFILTLLYAQARTPSEEHRITLGHTLGIAFLTIVSLVGALSKRLLPVQYVRWLGLVPILLGIRVLIGYWRSCRSNDAIPETIGPSGHSGSFSTAAVTVANGADNIGVYIPLFAGFASVQLLTAFAVFFLMNLFWCRLGRNISNLPFIRNTVSRYQELMMGSVFILIGLYVLIK